MTAYYSIVIVLKLLKSLSRGARKTDACSDFFLSLLSHVDQTSYQYNMHSVVVCSHERKRYAHSIANRYRWLSGYNVEVYKTRCQSGRIHFETMKSTHNTRLMVRCAYDSRGKTLNTSVFGCWAFFFFTSSRKKKHPKRQFMMLRRSSRSENIHGPKMSLELK